MNYGATVDSKVVEMGFDNSNFEKNVQQSLGTLDKLKNALNFNNESKAFDSLSKASSNVDFSGIFSATEKIGEKFDVMSIVAISALNRIVNEAITTGTQLVKALSVDQITAGWGKYEEKVKSVQTIMAATGEGIDIVDGYMEKLNWFTDETSYNFTDMTSNIGKFVSNGIDLDKSVNAMMGLSNWAALAGRGTQEASRAMYNLSQAIGTGYVGLMDWRSIELANMGTEQFKNLVIETAKAEGILNESTKITSKTFRESLKDKWFTSDLLVDVLNKYNEYSDLIYKIQTENGLDNANEAMQYLESHKEDYVGMYDDFAEAAFKAGQEAKTFSDAISAIKDAVSTSWMNVFETIFGNYEEAKGFWTEIANRAYDTFAEPVNRLQEVLDGWVQLGGRKNIMDSFWNIWDAISKIKEAGSTAFKEIFPPATERTLASLSARIRQVTESFILSGDKFDKLKTTFKGFFAILDIGKTAIKAILEPIELLSSKLIRSSGSILDLTSKWGEWLVNLDATIKHKDIFGKFVDKIVDGISKIKDKLSGLKDLAISKRVGEFFSGSTKLIKNNKGISGFVTAISDTYGKVSEKIRSFSFDPIINAGKSVLDMFKNIGEFLGKFIDNLFNVGASLINFIGSLNVGGIFTGIATVIKSVAEAIGYLFNQFQSSLGTNDLLGIIAVLTTLVNLDFKGFVSKLSDAAKELIPTWGSIKEIFDSALQIFNTEALGRAFKNISTAVLELAVALFILASIDQDKLEKAIAGITTMFGELIGTLALMNKMSSGVDKKNTSIRILASTISTIAFACIELAIAIKMLSDVEPDKMATAMGGLVGSVALLGLSLKLFPKDVKSIGSKLVGVGIGLVLLASALKIAATIDIAEMAIAVGGLASSITLIALGLKLMPKNLAGIGAGLIGVGIGVVIVSSALKILSTIKIDEMAIAVGGLASSITLIALGLKLMPKNLPAIGFGLIEVGTGVVILSAAIKILAGLDILNVGVAVAALAGSVTLIALGLKLMPKNLAGVGAGLILVSAGIAIIAASLKSLAGVDILNLGVAVAALAGSVTLIALGLKLMPKNLAGVGAGLILVSAGIAIIAGAIKNISELDGVGIAKGLIGIGGAMAILAGGLNLMKGTIGASASLIVASVALNLLTVPLTILGSMTWESIIKGLVGLGGALAIVGIAAVVLQPLAGALLILAGTIAVISVSFLAFGAAVAVFGAGLTLIGAGLASIASALSVGAVVIADGVYIIVDKLVSLIPLIIAKIGEGLVLLATAVIASAPLLAEAFIAIIEAICVSIVDTVPLITDTLLKTLVGVLESIVDYVPTIVELLIDVVIKIIDSLAEKLPELVISVADLIRNFINSLILAVANGDGIDIENIVQNTRLIAEMMAELTAIALLLPGATIGALGLVPIMTAITAIMDSIGKLSSSDKIASIEEASKLLEKLGSAIGGFIGSFVGSLTEGITAYLPKIAKDIKEFGEEIGPFLDQMSGTPMSAFDVIKNLAGAIITLTAADIVNGIASFMLGEGSLATFGEELAKFGPSLIAYAENVSSLDDDKLQAVVNSANALKVLATAASEIPNEGGWLAKVVGDNSIATFGEELAKFGPNFRTFFFKVSSLDDARYNSVVNSANALKVLATAASEIPNEGGWLAKVVGDNSIATFGEELAKFGPSLVTYVQSIASIGTMGYSKISESATAIADLVNIANSIPPERAGWMKAISGDNSLSAFGEEIAEFAPSLVTYVQTIAGLGSTDYEMANSSISAITSLATLAEAFGGTNLASFKDLGDNLKTFADNLVLFTTTMAAIEPDALSDAIYNTQSLVIILGNLNQAQIEAVESFAESMKSIAKDGLNGFLEVFENSADLVKSAINRTIDSAVEAAKLRRADFHVAGAYLVDGFCAGISENTFKAEAQAAAMAAAAAAAAEAELQINSPSKVGYSIGDFFGLGFVNAIHDASSPAENESKNLAKNTAEALSDSAKHLSKYLGDGLDFNPIIRPVVDLSDVSEKSRSIESIFSRKNAYRIGASISVDRLDAASYQHASQNNKSAGSTINFTQNNYSPKALSRLEIYRQTRNQLSTMKGLGQK